MTKILDNALKFLTGILFAGGLAIATSNAASAQTVTANFSVHNSFGSTITLDSASCSPSASIFATSSIANGGTANFSASTTGGTLLCTVRYHSGTDGCQMQVDVNSIGGSTTGFATSNAYEGSGGRPTCNFTSIPGSSSWTGSFTMQ